MADTRPPMPAGLLRAEPAPAHLKQLISQPQTLGGSVFQAHFIVYKSHAHITSGYSMHAKASAYCCAAG